MIFSATGITKGDIIGGIKQKEGYLSTETLMINGTDGSCNRIHTLHLH
ncbi:fructose-bisphosphatase class II [Serratia fonticola]